MHLRNNVEGAGRSVDLTRTASSRRTANESRPASAQPSTTAVPSSRGPFFDMLTAQTTPPAAAVVARTHRAQASAARPLSSDDNSAVRGASRVVPPRATPVRNSAVQTLNGETTAPAPTVPETPPPPSTVDILNSLLRKLGFEPANFRARVTSTRIEVPGIAYDYPMLEVTVNGERVGFHLPSVVHDPRITAANISSMMGRPVMSFSEFA